MKTFCTYCSKEKSRTAGLIPAIDRYLDHRIKQIYEHSKNEADEFLILSGSYGLLAQDDPIPYYEHLLMPLEVNEHAKKVAKQLTERKVVEIHFFHHALDRDKNVQPYLDCITLAAEQSGVVLKTKELT
jgi:predicted metallo-beta-lactamase superfamily hydrolase